MFINTRFQHSTIDNYFKLFLSLTNFKHSIEWTGENLHSISNFRIARSIQLSEFLFVDSLLNYTSLSLSSIIWWSHHSGMKGTSWDSQMLMASCYDGKWLILWNNRFPTCSTRSRRLLLPHPCSILYCFGWTSMWRAKYDRSINRQSSLSSIISSSMIRKKEWHSSWFPDDRPSHKDSQKASVFLTMLSTHSASSHLILGCY